MSQLTASIVSRTTTPFLNSARSSLLRGASHPSIPLKSTYPLSHQYKRYTSGGVNTPTYKLNYVERMHANTARLYARRILEIAAMSAASMVSTTSMESAVIDKPKEWATNDLVEERKRFGENISSLGKTKISRVWAAGEYYIVYLVSYCTCTWHCFCGNISFFGE